MNSVEETLTTTASKEEREEHKDQAVVLREQGDLAAALEMFDDIIAWDESHGNLRGKADVLGHKKITLVLLAVDAKQNGDIDLETQYLSQAEECIHQAINTLESAEDVIPSTIAIQRVHLASLQNIHGLKLAEASNEQATPKFEEALSLLDTALEDFPGTVAHRAWPLGIRAHVLHGLNRDDEAFATLEEARAALAAGYAEELAAGDQGELKIRVWNTGLMLCYAVIYADSGKPLLAEVYASAVLNTPDPDGVLAARRQQAQDILNRLNSSANS